jgi:hypothetical protein
MKWLIRILILILSVLLYKECRKNNQDTIIESDVVTVITAYKQADFSEYFEEHPIDTIKSEIITDYKKTFDELYSLIDTVPLDSQIKYMKPMDTLKNFIQKWIPFK